jgi:hypothetical protein
MMTWFKKYFSGEPAELGLDDRAEDGTASSRSDKTTASRRWLL